MNKAEREIPIGTFEETMSVEPTELQLFEDWGVNKKIELLHYDGYGGGESIGWLGVDKNNWCKIVSKKEQAISIKVLETEHGIRLKKAHTPKTKKKQVWLAAQPLGYHYVGFYSSPSKHAEWFLSGGNTLVGNWYQSDCPMLSYWSAKDKYLYTRGVEKYKAVSLKFHDED